MKPTIEYKGFWWLPQKPKLKVPGELRVDASGTIVLIVMIERVHFDLFESNEAKFKSIPVLNGYARNMNSHEDIAFTLYDNLVTGYRAGGLAEMTLRCSYYTTIKHFKEKDSLRIGSLYVKLQLLNDWVAINGLKGRKLRPSKNHKVSIDYVRPKEIRLYTHKNFQVYLWFKATTSRKSKSFALTESTHVNIEFKKQVNFEHAKEIYEIVRNFFAFCISFPIRAEEIQFRIYTEAQIKKSGSVHQHTYDMVISDTRSFTQRTELQSSNMLIDYACLSNRPSKLLEQWFKLNDRFEPVLRLYFDTLYNPDLYKENAFLNLVAALEIFHRILYPNFDGKDQAYSMKLEAILKQLKLKNDRDFIEARLKKRKETTLFKRLLHLLEVTPQISIKLARIGNVETFAALIANTRNYFTHYDEKNKLAGVAQGDDLFMLMHKTRIMVQVQLLLELGFNEDEIGTMVMKALPNWIVWHGG